MAAKEEEKEMEVGKDLAAGKEEVMGEEKEKGEVKEEVKEEVEEMGGETEPTTCLGSLYTLTVSRKLSTQ